MRTLLRHSGDETQLGPAAGALLNLIVSHEENMRSLVEAGAVEPLATVLRDGESIMP